MKSQRGVTNKERARIKHPKKERKKEKNKKTNDVESNAAPGAHSDAAFIYAMHFSISIFMGLKKRDTNNELTIRLIRSHQQVVTKDGKRVSE